MNGGHSLFNTHHFFGLNSGKLYMLSHQTYVDQNDCAALWPKGE